MDIANDNEEGTAAAIPAIDAVLPSGIRELLDQCDQAGVGMDVVMNVFRVRLYELGFDKTARTEKILTALRNVIERYR